MQRVIRECEAPRPSVKLRDVSSEVVKRRGVGRRQLANLLGADLDWIVLKSLRKDKVLNLWMRLLPARGIAASTLRESHQKLSGPSRLNRHRHIQQSSVPHVNARAGEMGSFPDIQPGRFLL